jgi:hypothetical protein
MGAETVVYGYICLDPSQREHNEAALARHPFDNFYPSTNIFSTIKPGYGGDVVSFAGGFKSLDEDWAEWEARFERLLSEIHGRAARLHLEHETDGAIKSVGYLCQDGWDSSKTLSEKSWTKWYYHNGVPQSAGIPVIREFNSPP